MSEYRFSVVDTPHQATPTVYRGRLYTLRDMGWDTSEEWSHYWDGDQQVAFYDEGYRGCRVVDGTDTEMGERAIRAYEGERDNETGAEGGMLRLAHRIAKAYGGDGSNRPCWVEVPLDRGMTLVAFCWDINSAADWPDEIAAVWDGDIYRIEVEEYAPGMGMGGSDWVSTDDVCEQWYGERAAETGFAREFPLAEFPADLLVDGEN